METWIALTLGAAFLQNIRSALQKYLKGRMGTTGATFVRFGFGLPFAWGFVFALNGPGGFPIPEPDRIFAFWAVTGGLSQILATALLVHLFSYRNFLAGTAYSRTEPVQAALFGLVFLGDRAGPAVLIAIALSVAGVVLLSLARAGEGRRAIPDALFSREAAIGLASGALFALAAVSYRAASLSLGSPGFLMQAAFTLAMTVTFQSFAMLAWMLLRKPEQLRLIARAWMPSLMVGATGAAASLGWFAAMTLEQAAIVKTLAQVEILFTLGVSVFIFRERIAAAEIAGSFLVVAGIVALLAA